MLQVKKPSTGVASLMLFAVASAWGLYWIPLREIEEMGVSGGWAIALVNGPAAIVLMAISALNWRENRRFLLKAALIGLFSGAGLACYGAGLVYSSVVRTTMLFYLMPIWGTLLGVFWLGEKAGPLRWVAIALGLVGLFMMLSGGGSVPLNFGDVLAFASGIFWAIAASMIVRFHDVPVDLMTGLQFAATTLIALLIGVGMGEALVPPADAIAEAWVLSTAVSLLGFLPAVCLIFWLQKQLYPGRAGLLMMSEVIFAVLSATLLLPEETMSTLAWMGAGLIIVACLVEIFGSQSGPVTRQASDLPG